MANNDNVAKMRLGKLKKKAEKLGITFNDDVTEEVLNIAIAEAEEAEGTSNQAPETPKAGSIPASSFSELGDAIAQGLAKANATAKKNEEDNSLETYYEPDPKDIGEVKFYFVPMIFWTLPKKRIGGRVVNTPYNQRIDFKHDSGNAVQTGNQWQTRYTAVYSTDNKKIQAYMETHPMFGRLFFLSQREVSFTNDQVKYAQAYSKRMQALTTVMAPGLYRLGATLGLNFSHDMSLNTIRTVLAEKQAELDVANAKAQLNDIMIEQQRQTLITDPQQR